MSARPSGTQQHFIQGSYGARPLEPVGPGIHQYKTQGQELYNQTGGGLEFRDCQNPDASDGYIVGPNEKVPGYEPEYIKSQPHRELTDEECERYGLPKGTVLMATVAERNKGEVPIIQAPRDDILDQEEQIKQWFKQNGVTRWTGQEQPTFSATGLPVPAKFTMPNYNPSADLSQISALDSVQQHRTHTHQYEKHSANLPLHMQGTHSPDPLGTSNAPAVQLAGYSTVRSSHMGHG